MAAFASDVSMSTDERETASMLRVVSDRRYGGPAFDGMALFAIPA